METASVHSLLHSLLHKVYLTKCPVPLNTLLKLLYKLLLFTRILFCTLRPYVCSRQISRTLRSSLYRVCLLQFEFVCPSSWNPFCSYPYPKSSLFYSRYLETSLLQNPCLIILSCKTFLNTVFYFVVLFTFNITDIYVSILSPLLDNKMLNIRI